jgi:small-conductance mechanosensitive channel
MADMPMRLQVVDDLHTTIDQEFRRAKIEIAFPQQDLHIQGLEALAGFQKKAS